MDAIYQIVERVWERKVAFISVFFLVFTLTYTLLFIADFLPEEPSEQLLEEEVISSNDSQQTLQEVVPVVIEPVEEQPVDTVEEDVEAANPEFPLSISIKKLDKTITVLNPVSRTIADLDEALLDGVVRHPDSAALTQEGNVFILGHSSYLPNVFNKNFQAFNGIEDLAWGDIIEVTSENMVYEYRVEEVYRANAQELVVPIAGTGHKLTLATCNSFGSIDDRFIVEATRIDARSL